MLRFAILKPVKESESGQTLFRPVLEGADGDIKRELTSRVRQILGPKRTYTIGEVTGAIDTAFEQYKQEFKEQTVKLP